MARPVMPVRPDLLREIQRDGKRCTARHPIHHTVRCWMMRNEDQLSDHTAHTAGFGRYVWRDA